MQLDPNIVLDTLYDRVMRDCGEAANHVTLADIVGCLETIKLSFFQGHYLEVTTRLTENMRGGMTEQ